MEILRNSMKINALTLDNKVGVRLKCLRYMKKMKMGKIKTVIHKLVFFPSTVLPIDLDLFHS